jgi:hypothetical protein
MIRINESKLRRSSLGDEGLGNGICQREVDQYYEYFEIFVTDAERKAYFDNQREVLAVSRPIYIRKWLESVQVTVRAHLGEGRDILSAEARNKACAQLRRIFSIRRDHLRGAAETWQIL